MSGRAPVGVGHLVADVVDTLQDVTIERVHAVLDVTEGLTDGHPAFEAAMASLVGLRHAASTVDVRTRTEVAA